MPMCALPFVARLVLLGSRRTRVVLADVRESLGGGGVGWVVVDVFSPAICAWCTKHDWHIGCG